MKLKSIVVLLLVMLLSVFGFSAQEMQEKSFPVSGDGSFSLKNINGNIELSVHKKDAIEIRAEKIARTREELSEVEVVYEHMGNSLAVKTRRRKSRSHTKVNFYVTVPEKIKVHLKSVNGRIKALGALGKVDFEAVNGKIQQDGVFTHGHFHTVNGNVGIILRRKLSGDLDAKSVNGSIRIELPGESSFAVRGSTLNGGFSSDFDVEIIKRLVGRKMVGSVRGGDFRIGLKTINGSIKLLKI